MKKKLSLIIPSIVLVIFILFSFLNFARNNNGINKTISENEIVLDTTYFDAENKSGGLLFITSDRGRKLYTDFSSNLSKSDLAVSMIKLDVNDSKNYNKIDMALKELKSKSNLQNSDIIIAGYDVGGFELLKYLSDAKEKYAGAILLSPFLEKYDEKSIAINNGSYSTTIPWIDNLNKESFDFPILILSTTTDDCSTPQLMTILYNHLSGDDIQRSVGAFSAKKGSVSLAIETGVLHRFIPVSDNVFLKVQSFIADEVHLNISKIHTNMYLQHILWFGIILSAVCVMIVVYNNSIKFKFTDISMGIVSAKINRGWIYFLIKILSVIIAIILTAIISPIVTKVIGNINPATTSVSSLIGISGILGLIFFKKLVLPNDTQLFRNNQINKNKINLMISFLVVLFNILIFLSIIFTGYFYNAISKDIIFQGMYILLMSFVGIYAYTYEVDTIKVVLKEKYVDIVYELIILLPLSIIFLWYIVTTQYSLSYVAITNIAILIITIVSTFIMKEINGNRCLTSVIMAIFYTLIVTTIH